jgi:hypothetical protein
MIPALLASIGLPILAQAVTDGLRKIDNPIARAAADALDQVGGAIKNGQISLDEVKEANRHLEAMAALESAESKTALEQVNASLRAEVASEDKYVRRMRPTFGYIMAATWGAQMLSIAYTILADPQNAGAVMNGMADLSAIWSVGLAVLGIYVYRRSGEKRGN